MAPDRVNLLDLTYPELQQMVVEWGEPRFRATQIWRWIYHGLTYDPGEMANLPQEMRARLAAETYIGNLEPTDSLLAEDGLTEKALFETQDGHSFEAVLMRYPNRNTTCC